MASLRDHKTRTSFRSAVAKVALAEAKSGVHESPAGSNKQKYGAWYGFNGVPWCAMFVSWVYAQAAERVGCENPLAGLKTAKGFSGTISAYSKGKKLGWALDRDEAVMLGDIVIWKHTSVTGHTGVVTKVFKDGSFNVTEGNTDGNFSRTGGMVRTHKHSKTDGLHTALLGILRPTRKFFS